MSTIDMRVSDQDIESLARKLAEFTQALSPGERLAFELIEQQMVSLVNAEEMDVTGFEQTDLDTMGADAHREELLRQGQTRRAPRNREGFWQAVLASLTGDDKRRGR
ncbi:MAG: hypothetical protein ACRD1H_06880 [Vicinamibacterales bacterium]